jgi:NAD(P)-dependent dehydrogenase (short-subunit alcohol dehydrogenase family)
MNVCQCEVYEETPHFHPLNNLIIQKLSRNPNTPPHFITFVIFIYTVPPKMTGRLQGKTAIVTGAASGFGRGIAAKFAAEGANVIIADLSSEAGEAAAKELNGVFSRTDVTDPKAWEDVLQLALSKFGGLDIVVNNAGATYANKPTEDVTEKDFDLVMNVNVKGVYHSTNVLVPYFLKEKRPGCFIQVASTAGTRPRPKLTWYNASKAAVINASKTMAVEYGPQQIRFNCVSPVVGSTGMCVNDLLYELAL